MADRVPGDRIFCHECEHEWPRDSHGLSCPRCQSEFVEILDEHENIHETLHESEHDADNTGHNSPGGQQQQSPRNASARADDAMQVDSHPIFDTFNAFNSPRHVTRHHYQSPDGSFQFTSTTIRSPDGRGIGGGIRMGMATGPAPGEDALGPLFRTFNTILRGIAETQPNRGGIPPGYGTQSPNHDQTNNYRDSNPPEILGGGLYPRDADRAQRNAEPVLNINDILAIMHGAANPNYRGGGVPLLHPIAALTQALGMQHHGDAVYSQEELDRVISQLVDQNINGNAPAPASADAIRSLPKVKVDKSMLGSENKAECSICMDNVELDTEVTMLPCKHWFHESCITAWLNEHDTCPHCRQGIMATYQQTHGISQQQQQQQGQNIQGSTNGPLGSSSNPIVTPLDSAQGQSSSMSDMSQRVDRPSRSLLDPPGAPPQRSNSESNSGGGLAGWMRYHFGGGTS
ncbi:hypothetical protein H112_05862 [Trichophyton rubrum D6]|uniref:RING-type E3 ubiquitin transferase n=5 Tax=Trichophyton TaxID=5550 RepID=A0A178ERB6_TRIRU|nr:uncharacterized protein TERG_03569 [Trichophyton rubrum CBS 118892]EZF16024.1 hypothetical protein H100_05877 [Trichophyton rubrum MR850]EZF40153.1 hypothetical protein H102_05846 [Trichophyton rubrum CBS 100081]EZF50786.1 hypothetical protein H103_05873 [Trichophyton rubrum CBS 288.86]EZF61382.1 hypothetical protein H104_05859 [Trichophyton rubrum CBS 289.86]EZF82698.1 hypothetical protein H110_05868 [Trichophyton rubrum MR1448]EZF93393.1 hypothetical protein H113_05914 [Trichophyton rubr